MESFQRFALWQPPLDHQRSRPATAFEIRTLDCHTGGEPLRIITAGFPELHGDSVLAKRRHCQQHFDGLRRALMWEPRGHADMYGCIVVSPERVDSAFGVIFLHNEGYSTMCGHAMSKDSLLPLTRPSAIARSTSSNVLTREFPRPRQASPRVRTRRRWTHAPAR